MKRWQTFTLTNENQVTNLLSFIRYFTIMGAIWTPPEFGVNCALCWAAGETPNKLHCFLGDISMGALWHAGLPVPPNDFYVLKQLAGGPCQYQYEGDNYKIYLTYELGFSSLIAKTPTNEDIFSSNPLVQCEQYFPNDLTEPPNRHYHGGFAYITSMESLILDVEAIIPIRRESARFEVHPGPGRIIDVRVADSYLQQNMLVQLDKS